MSRVAKKPIPLPKGIDCQVQADAITVKGSLGSRMKLIVTALEKNFPSGADADDLTV